VILGTILLLELRAALSHEGTMEKLRTVRPFSLSLSWFAILVACLVSARQTVAQSNLAAHSMSSMMGMQDETPPDQLPVPQKMSGIGNTSMKITATPEAQMWFNQGLNLLHDFWEYESARAFDQGIRVDPQCAMCYWGLYKAEGSGNSNAKDYALPALAKAVALEGHVSSAERLYIDASVAHEDALKAAKPGQALDFAKEQKLWRKLVKQHPKEMQAKIFMTQSVGNPNDYLKILQDVLKDEPENSAANHYWIHAREASPHPEEALHSAEILASLAPNSGHIVHMPGHIYYLMGDYGRAEKAFTASMEIDERYMQEQHVQPGDDWNYVHNLMYAIANLLEEGKLNAATSLSTKLPGARGQFGSTLYTNASRDSISRVNPLLPVALRTADWQQVVELLDESVPPAEHANLGFLARSLADFAGGMQAIETQSVTQAEELSLRVDAGLWQASQQAKDSAAVPGNNSTAPVGGTPKLQAMPDALLQPLVSNLSVMSLELRGGILILKKQTNEGEKLFAEAAKEEKALGYREPPNFIRPVGETEGAALIAVGDWADAKAAYNRALLERPKSGFALYGIARCSELAGDAKQATADYAVFLAAWKDADPALTQLVHARAYVGEHEQATASK
jgi:tetratricopeptide (TPR) repeat protein